MGEIGNVWVTIGAKTDGLKQGLSQAKTGMQGVGKSADNLKQSFQKTAAIAATVGAALVAIGQAYKATVGEAEAYAYQVRELSRLSGAGADQSSRLIQMADDLTISYESLSTGLKIASRSGIEPTVDSLASMSDEFLKLAPGAERNAFLLKNFGRSGLEMGKLLEVGSTGLKKMSSEMSGGLILTEASITKMRQYEIAMDDFGDAIQGLKVKAGLKMANPVTAFIKTITDTKTPEKSWFQKILPVAGLPVYLADAENKITTFYDNIKELESTELVIKFSVAAEGQLPPIIQDLINGAGTVQTEMEKARLAIVDLSMAGMGQETLANLDRALADGKITQEEYNAAAEYTMRTLLGMSDTEIAGFEKVSDLNTNLANSDISAWEYAAGMQEVYNILADIKGLGAITLPLATGGNIGKQKGGVQEGYGGASGLSMIVPAGFPNDSFNVRASSGEKVTIEPLGGSGKEGGDGVKIYGNVTFIVPQGVSTARGLFQSMRETAAA